MGAPDTEPVLAQGGHAAAEPGNGGKAGSPCAKATADARCKVDALYNLMQSFESKLGGGEGVEGLYGSITQAGMQKILDCLKRNTGLDRTSAFVDIGAGLGRPLLHAMVACGLGQAWGVELDRIKCDKAAAFVRHVLRHLEDKGMMPAESPVPDVKCMPVEQVSSLDPATHAYSFWEGVPLSGKMAFGKLFAKSKTLRAVSVVQRAIRGQDPAAVMYELGFGRLLLLSSFSVKMSGSGRSFTAYVFAKINPTAAGFLDQVRGLHPVDAPQASSSSSDVDSEDQEATTVRTARDPQLPTEASSLDSADAAARDGRSDAGPLSGRPRKPDPREQPANGSPSKKTRTPTKEPPASAADGVKQEQPHRSEAAAPDDAPATAPRPSRAAAGPSAAQKRLTRIPQYTQRVAPSVAAPAAACKPKAAAAAKAAGSAPAAAAAEPAARTRASQRAGRAT